jgi:hypothetical protein
MSKGKWNLRPTEVARLVGAVKATGLSVRNVEYSTEAKLIRVNIGPAAEANAVEAVEPRAPVVL